MDRFLNLRDTNTASGLAMLTGVLIRIGAICIINVMLGALTVHLPHGYDITKGGAEFVTTQLLIALAILIGGPGAYSLGSALLNPLRKFIAFQIDCLRHAGH
jgi:putative oxidoreductase